MLGREGLGGVLINAQHNFAWITCGSTNGIDLSRENGAASILLTESGKRYLLANNIEMPRMLAEEVSADDVEPFEYSWQDEKANGNVVIEMATALCGGKVASDYSIENKIAPCRYSLTADEIVRYRSLGSDAASVIQKIAKAASPGETEIEIAEKLRNELAMSDMTSVVTLVAADERIAQYRHPIPSAKRFEKTLLLVTCAKRGGLIVSLSRMISIGEVPSDLVQKTEATAFVNVQLLDTTRVGVTGSEFYKTAAKAYAECGFEGEINRHHQGGAAGYKTREWVAHPNSGEIVQENQAFAWNPSITGTKVEETVLATSNGIEILTSSPSFPQIETVIDGRSYFSPGILSI